LKVDLNSLYGKSEAKCKLQTSLYNRENDAHPPIDNRIERKYTTFPKTRDIVPGMGFRLDGPAWSDLLELVRYRVLRDKHFRIPILFHSTNVNCLGMI
jgi:hypothetical protein